MPPSGEPVKTSFSADHEGAELFEEYSGTSVFEGNLSKRTPGYFSATAFKAEVTGIDGYARAQANKAQTGWLGGQKFRFSGAFWLPEGFFEAKEGQIDIFRWDNFEQDEITTERGGFVFHGEEDKLRFVRIKEGEPDVQHSFNLEGETVLGPTIREQRWYFVEGVQTLWPEDGDAFNQMWLNGNLVAVSTDRNCDREDIEVSRYRAGIAASSGNQKTSISLVADHVASGPLPKTGPLGRSALPLSKRHRLVNP